MVTNFIFVFLTLGQFFRGIAADCVSYGECNTDEKGLTQNCPYSGPAKPLPDADFKIFQEHCPRFQSATFSGNATCCNGDQVRTFVSKLSIVRALLARCPSCYESMLSFLCTFLCHPDQDSFVEVVDTATNSKNVKYITSIRMYISNETMNGIFDSCKRVMMPTTGQLVFDLFCGSWGSEKCTAQRLFTFMGTKSEHVPFTIDYVTEVKENSPYKLIKPPTYPCHKAVDNSTAACSCVDCPESCPVYAEYEDLKEPLFRMEYYLFALMLIALSVAVLVYKTFPVHVIFYMKNSDSKKETTLNTFDSEDEQKKKDISCSCEVPFQTNLEIRLQNCFTRLGEICASYPWSILLVGTLFIIVTAQGIRYIDLTIDPVELWTTNGSQCRQERQYFNENFGPFYRIEQVIFSAKSSDYIVRNSNTSDGEETFGPAFNKTFLLQFSDLQTDILKLGGSTNGLQNICVSPLAKPGEKLSIKNCLVLSVWGYFKNNKRLFNRSLKLPNGQIDDYLSHIKKCIQNSYNSVCLADYGGPVDPATAMGGFLAPGESLSKSDSFLKSTSLSLTILVQNHLNKAENEAALRWEQLFIDYMKNYTKNKPDNVEVSFFSERSIEDEVDRESKASVAVVAISYGVMFLYISLILGQFQFVYQFLLESKIVLGFAGVILVLSSVVVSVGINSSFGISVTMIALEENYQRQSMMEALEQ